MDMTSALLFADPWNDLGVVLCLLIYFIPTVIAACRKSSAQATCFWGNLFLGWSGLGWGLCLFYACVSPTRAQLAYEQKVQRAKDQFYLRQAESAPTHP